MRKAMLILLLAVDSGNAMAGWVKVDSNESGILDRLRVDVGVCQANREAEKNRHRKDEQRETQKVLAHGVLHRKRARKRTLQITMRETQNQ